jgi:uncharacterized membrane protein YcjF (UPF0283 family)
MKDDEEGSLSEMSKGFNEVEAHQTLFLVGLICFAIGAWVAHGVVAHFKVGSPLDAVVYGVSMAVVAALCFLLFIGVLIICALWSSRKEKQEEQSEPK